MSLIGCSWVTCQYPVAREFGNQVSGIFGLSGGRVQPTILTSVAMWYFPPSPPSNSWIPVGILQFNSILILPTWRKHQMPQVKGSVPQVRFPSPTSDNSARDPEVPVPPSLGFINLVEWLMELRETFLHCITGFF